MATTTLAQILRRHWAAYVAHYGADRILPSHHAAAAAILSCHTPQCGGSVYRCACGGMHFTFHGCGHRACPQCGQREAQTWIECQTARLFPVPYHLVTFTVPEQLRLLMRSNQRLLLDLLFKESAATLQDVSHSKLRADLGSAFSSTSCPRASAVSAFTAGFLPLQKSVSSASEFFLISCRLHPPPRQNNRLPFRFVRFARNPSSLSVPLVAPRPHANHFRFPVSTRSFSVSRSGGRPVGFARISQ